MQIKMTQRALPSAIAIEAEAVRVEKLIAAVTNKIDSSGCDLRTFMHLQMCRAELQTYFAWLLYAMGYTNLIDTQHVEAHLHAARMGTFADQDESLIYTNDMTKTKVKPQRIVQYLE